MITLELLKSITSRMIQEEDGFLSKDKDFFAQIVEEIANSVRQTPRQIKVEIYQYLKRLILNGKEEEIYGDSDLALVFPFQDFEKFCVDEEKYREQQDIKTKMEINNFLAPDEDEPETPLSSSRTSLVPWYELTRKQKLTQEQEVTQEQELTEEQELTQEQALTQEQVFKAACQVLMEKKNSLVCSDISRLIKPEYAKCRSARKKLPKDVVAFNQELRTVMAQLVEDKFLILKKSTYYLNLKCSKGFLKKFEFSDETVGLYQTVVNKLSNREKLSTREKLPTQNKLPPVADLISRFRVGVPIGYKRKRGEESTKESEEPPTGLQRN